MPNRVDLALPELPPRPEGLPRFGNPPLREVALAVLFQPLAGLQQPHVGRYWELIKEDYPRTADRPPTDPYLEGGTRGRPLFQVQVGPPPLRRSWFISEGDERLVQLQSDRFVHNWRGEGEAYPHLESLWASFIQRFLEFSGWVEQEGIGVVEPFQLELSYVNFIEGGSLWDVLSGMAPPMPARHADDVEQVPEPKIELRYQVDSDSPSALYVHCRPREPGVQQVELTYRAILSSPATSELPQAVATGRRLIVAHFTELTRPDYHDRWDRQQ